MSSANMVTSTNGKITLAAGVDIKTLKNNTNKIVATLKALNDMITDHSAGLFVHYATQPGVGADTYVKGNVSLITDFMQRLYHDHRSAYNAVAAAARDILGLQLSAVPVEGSETDFKIKAEFTKTARDKVFSEFPEKIVKLVNLGLFSEQLSYAKRKQPKLSAGKKASADQKPSEVVDKTFADKVLADSGIGAVLATAAEDDAKAKRLEHVQGKLAELLALCLDAPESRADQLLDSTINKMKGFVNVNSVVNKKAS